MVLSTDELARIETAIAQGRIYDEPGSLSCTDAALRDLGFLAAEGSQPGRPIRRPRSPRRDSPPREARARAVNWLDLPDLDRLIALRRRLLLDGDALG